ncbi:hypothetical protein [Halorubrum pallidum]
MTDAAEDPTRIRSIAVHREDVANALEATIRTDTEVVLRVTTPFSGRMRARLHAVSAAESGDDPEASETGSAAVHVDPRALVEDIPAYPEVDETAAEHPDADVETRRRRHAEAVEAWRERVREAIADSVTLDVDEKGGRDSVEAGHGGDETGHDVDVTALG